MASRSLSRFAAAGLLAAALTGCASMSGLFIQQSDSSLSQVDGLLEDVEHVHVEAVLCRDRMREALLALNVLVGPDFGGDALESYARFEDAVDRVEAQQESLRARAEPMQRTANQVFAAWTLDLKEYSSEALAQHSRDRLEETRERYDAILAELEPAREGYAQLAGVLRDMALFLKHDFNAAAVHEIQREVTGLAHQVVKLDRRFLNCQQAAQVYVQSGALRGQMVLSRRGAPVVSSVNEMSGGLGPELPPVAPGNER
ncbi:MAG: hypothetical protein DHS20C15_29980 [Planctomycetota bacterium]|nr:MAG: hypothetical protein DHS20C15_29980 [Planctomycetota bacterium]